MFHGPVHDPKPLRFYFTVESQIPRVLDELLVFSHFVSVIQPTSDVIRMYIARYTSVYSVRSKTDHVGPSGGSLSLKITLNTFYSSVRGPPTSPFSVKIFTHFLHLCEPLHPLTVFLTRPRLKYCPLPSSPLTTTLHKLELSR